MQKHVQLLAKMVIIRLGGSTHFQLAFHCKTAQKDQEIHKTHVHIQIIRSIHTPAKQVPNSEKVMSQVKHTSRKLTSKTTGFFCHPLASSSCCPRRIKPSLPSARPSSLLWLRLCRVRVDRYGNDAGHRLQVKETFSLLVTLARGCCR